MKSSDSPTRATPPQRIYAASRASLPERPAMWKLLRDEGFNIVSSWIDEAEPGATADLSELWVRIAAEIASADGLVLYVEEQDFPLKGALIEVGIALALNRPIHVALPDIELSAPSYRPLGSWVMHPNVVRFKNVRQACNARFVAEAVLPSPPPQLQGDTDVHTDVRVDRGIPHSVSGVPADSVHMGGNPNQYQNVAITFHNVAPDPRVGTATSQVVSLVSKSQMSVSSPEPLAAKEADSRPKVRSEWRGSDLWWSIGDEWISDVKLREWCHINLRGTQWEHVDVIREGHIEAYAFRSGREAAPPLAPQPAKKSPFPPACKHGVALTVFCQKCALGDGGAVAQPEQEKKS
jgi:hypothetical protein